MKKIILKLLKGLLVALFLIINSYGIFLANLWIISFASFDGSSKFALEIIDERARDYSEDKDKIEEEKIRIAGLFEEEVITLYKSQDKEAIEIKSDFNERRREAILGLAGIKRSFSLWLLIPLGLLINILSLASIAFIFQKGGEILNGTSSPRITQVIRFLPSIVSFLLISFWIFSFASESIILDFGVSLSLVAILISVVFSLLFVREKIMELSALLYGANSSFLAKASYSWLKRVEPRFFEGSLSGVFSRNPSIIIDSRGIRKISLNSHRSEYLGVDFMDISNQEYIPLDRFFFLMNQGSKFKAFDRLSAMLSGEVQKALIGGASRDGVAKATNSLINSFSKKGKKLLVEEKLISNNMTLGKTEEEINSILIKAMRSFRKRFFDLVSTKTNEIFGSLKSQILEHGRELEMGDSSSQGAFASIRLPSNTRFVVNRGDTSVFVVELPPQKRTINHSDSSYHLSFPYTIFVVSFRGGDYNGLHFFYSNKPLKSLSESVYLSNLPNINNDGGVCTGNSIVSLLQNSEALSLSEKVDMVVSAFWGDTFNDDLDDRFEEYGNKHPRLKGFSSWEKASHKEPNFILSINWERSDSLMNLIEAIFADCGDEISVSNFERKNEDKIDYLISHSADFLREKLLSSWGGIELDKITEEEVRKIGEVEKDVVLKSISLLRSAFSDIIQEREVGKDFLEQINKAFKGVIEEKLGELYLSIPFERQVGLDDLVNQRQILQEGQASQEGIPFPRLNSIL